MFDADTRAVLRALIEEICNKAGQYEAGQYENAARAQVAAKILAAAGREAQTLDELREIGEDALKSTPTMWRY
jgi:hypothetical protein